MYLAAVHGIKDGHCNREIDNVVKRELLSSV
jgi:hypothetical protein